jgi:phospholipid transport system substrate-binding protein
MMRAICFAIALSISALGARALAQDVSPPDALVKKVTLEVLDAIAKDKDIQAGDRRKTIDLIERKVLPHFNFSGMTALALGASWRRASAEQKKLLTGEFKTLLLRTYASALASYQGQKLEFRPLRAKAGESEVTVNVRVLQPGGQPVAIDYDMERTAEGWKVYNLSVGGISLVLNYRTEFNNAVSEAGIDGLIERLRAKNRALEPGGSSTAR